jgi:VanZ family protein
MTLLFRLAAVLITVAIVHLSLGAPGDRPAPLHVDKVKHFVAYGSLAGAMMLGWARVPVWRIVLLAALFGVGMEIAQGLGGLGRTASVADGIANLVGAATGALSARFLLRKGVFPSEK